MSPSRSRSEKVALAAMITGGVAIVLGLAFVVLGGSSSDKPSAVPPRSTTLPTADFDGRTQDERVRDQKAAEQQKALNALGSGAEDPFASAEGDTSPHKVSITFTADGSLYAGYRFRNGGEGIKVADRTLTVNRVVNGPLPLAQVGVQVVGDSTFATCTITVDGVTVTTQTARGKGFVVVCTA